MSEFISLQQGVDMTTLFRQDKENVLAANYKNQNILPKCETFDRADFDALLARADCAFIRIYYGMDADLKVHAIIVAADANGADILPSVTAPFGSYIVEDGMRCPNDCPPPSALNS